MDWTDEYATGIQDIDKDHQILVQLLTEVEEAVANKKGAASILSALEQLVNMTRAHFDHEVAVMRIQGYPKVQQHVNDHAEFQSQLSELETRTFAGAAWTEALGLFRRLLDQHMLSSDKDYALFVRRGYKL